MIRRGVEDLLIQRDDGLLQQIGLEERRPRRIEWSMQLPMTGELDLFRDTLRVTGETGWLDFPLPELAPPFDAEEVECAELFLPGTGWVKANIADKEVQPAYERANWLRLQRGGSSVLIALKRSSQMDQ